MQFLCTLSFFYLQNKSNVVYLMTQSTIFNISLDIVQLGLLLGSVDPQTHVLCEVYNIDIVLLLKKFVFKKKISGSIKWF